MTVTATFSESGPYVGNGVATTFAYTFRIENAAHIRVYRKSVAGVTTALSLNTDYTVTGVGTAGGNVVLNSPLPSGVELYLVPNRPYTQTTNFKSQGGFLPDVHERAIDNLTYQIQQLRALSDRSLKIPRHEFDFDMLPLELADRTSTVLTFDINGEPLPMSFETLKGILQLDIEGITELGQSLITATNTGAIRWFRAGSDNELVMRTTSEMRTDLNVVDGATRVQDFYVSGRNTTQYVLGLDYDTVDDFEAILLTLQPATTSLAGLMSAADKTKLEALNLSFNDYSISQNVAGNTFTGTARVYREGKRRTMAGVILPTSSSGDPGDFTLFTLDAVDRPPQIFTGGYSGVVGVFNSISTIESPGSFSLNVNGLVGVNSVGTAWGNEYYLFSATWYVD